MCICGPEWRNPNCDEHGDARDGHPCVVAADPPCAVPGCVERWGPHGPHCAELGDGSGAVRMFDRLLTGGMRGGRAPADRSPCVLEPGHAGAHAFASPDGNVATVRTKDGGAWYVTTRVHRMD